MKTDPFRYKAFAKWNPRRALPTLYARLQEAWARWRFDSYRLPQRAPETLPDIPEIDEEDTAVTRGQMRYLIEAARTAGESVSEGVFVKVGCYRGVTTRCLAKAIAPRRVIGVDPFIGWGGAADDQRIFERRTSDLDNVIHEKSTSGQAARNWTHGPVAFAFVDAVHDYWNTTYDLAAWGAHLAVGGLLAAHDAAKRVFAGTRRAVHETEHTPSYDLYTSTENLTILRKVGDNGSANDKNEARET
jgi:hypothetical protein